MRRGTSSVASAALCAALLGAGAGACNALTGASDLVPCEGCELDAASALLDAEADAVLVDGDGSAAADGRDGAAPKDASVDAASEGSADGGVDAAIGCQGAVACTRVVFVSSKDYMGSLGGIVGADAKCQALADVSTNARIKGRTFQAWISTSATPVSARFTHGSQAYVLGDATMIAADWTELVSGSLTNGIDVDELGDVRTNTSAWTGTTSSGAGFAGADCNGWTVGVVGTPGTYGKVGGSGGGWSSFSLTNCIDANALYCFEK